MGHFLTFPSISYKNTFLAAPYTQIKGDGSNPAHSAAESDSDSESSPLGSSVMKHAVNSPASPEVPTAGGGELALLKASSLSGHSPEGKTWTRKTRKSHLPGSVTPPKLPTFRLRVPCSQIKHGQENLWFISIVFIRYLLKVYTGPNPWVTH